MSAVRQVRIPKRNPGTNETRSEPRIAIDLFAGCGGMSEGLIEAGFKVVAAVELDPHASKTYRLNHENTELFQTDIRGLSVEDVKDVLSGRRLDLLAGCPPCQGFSSIRRLNRREPVADDRNDLLLEFLRFVEALEPMAIMMENVPGLENYHLFQSMVKRLKELGYNPKHKIVNVANFDVPQRRRRLVLVGSLLDGLEVLDLEKDPPSVWDTIGSLEPPAKTDDPVHKIYPRHTPQVMRRIRMIPKDGGSRSDLPAEEQLACHQKANVGFNDVYGRLRWDDVSSTITGGCLNPSKGRFLHPEQDRCITAREAALLQTFRPDYKFPADIPRYAIALQIGNALPPKFCFHQASNIMHHLDSRQSTARFNTVESAS